MRDEYPSHHDHLAAAGPAVDVHGRVVTAKRRAAARYRQAQRAADSAAAATALRLAVHADPAFGLAVADLDAITGTASQRSQSPADELGAPPHRSGPRRSHRQGQASS